MSVAHPRQTQRDRIDATISGLASARYGLFTRADAMRAGATPQAIRTRLRSGRWDALHRGVYRIAGAPVSYRQQLLAACLWIPGAVASYFSAGALWHLDGLEPGLLWITVPRGNHRHHSDIEVREADVPAVDQGKRYWIPVTSPARTLLDLASVLAQDPLEEAVDSALRERIVTLRQLRRRLDQRGVRGRPGTQAMRATLAIRDPSDPAFGSRFERTFMRTLKGAGLPEPVRQFIVLDSAGRPITRVDYAYPELRVAIEADSWRHHFGRLAWERDHGKRDAMMLLGWRIVHVTWRQMVEHPDRVTDKIYAARALAATR